MSQIQKCPEGHDVVWVTPRVGKCDCDGVWVFVGDQCHFHLDRVADHLASEMRDQLLQKKQPDDVLVPA